MLHTREALTIHGERHGNSIEGPMHSELQVQFGDHVTEVSCLSHRPLMSTGSKIYASRNRELHGGSQLNQPDEHPQGVMEESRGVSSAMQRLLQAHC